MRVGCAKVIISRDLRSILEELRRRAWVNFHSEANVDFFSSLPPLAVSGNVNFSGFYVRNNVCDGAVYSEIAAKIRVRNYNFCDMSRARVLDVYIYIYIY